MIAHNPFSLAGQIATAQAANAALLGAIETERGRRAARDNGTRAKHRAAILAYLRTDGPGHSQAQISRGISARRETVREIVAELAAEKLVKGDPGRGGVGGKWWRAA